MEKHQVIFSTSSTSLASASCSNNAHVKKDVSRTQRKAKSSGLKESGKGIKRNGYAFQTRSQIDVMDDGYQWRKYRKKTLKNNKFPRSYYRCSHRGCHVKKQIQRHCEDEQIVVTTYEGMHTHHPVEKSS